jgi:amidase
MARQVEDLILALSIIAGPDPEDPEVISAPLEDPHAVDITTLRVAHFTENGKSKANFEMAQAVRSAAETLANVGLKCQPARLPGFETGAELQRALNRSEGDYYQQLLNEYGTTNPSPQISGFLQQMRSSGPSSPRNSADLLADWENLRQSSLNFMRDFEILICPPCSNTAPQPQHVGLLDYSYSSFFNLLGWPAAVIRVGRTATGLPKAVQIIGRPWQEHQVLAIALHLEKKLGGWKKDFPEQNLITPKKP